MHRPQKQMLPGREPDEPEPEQGAGRQLKRMPGLFGEQFRNPPVVFRRGNTGQILHRQEGVGSGTQDRTRKSVSPRENRNASACSVFCSFSSVISSPVGMRVARQA